MRVVNEGAPSVLILAPADGARVPAGREIPVRAESRDAAVLWMAVNGARRWSTGGDRLAGAWAPPPGTHTIVAVAEREGAPDAVDTVTIVAVADPAGQGPGPAPPPAGRGPDAAGPGAPVRGAAPRPGPVPAPAPTAAPRPLAGSAAAPPPARGAEPVPGAGGRPGGRAAAAPGGRPPAASASADRRRSPWARIIAGDLQTVAGAAALPLLLLLAAGAYALLQRFIDGGAKLAWRSRGRPDDVVVEF